MPEEALPIYEKPISGERGMTELHSAAWAGDLQGVLAEIQAGADVNAWDHGECPPLHWLVDMGMDSNRLGRPHALSRPSLDLEEPLLRQRGR